MMFVCEGVTNAGLISIYQTIFYCFTVTAFMQTDHILDGAGPVTLAPTFGGEALICRERTTFYP